jgi:pimeloyl-ACP methyl ester carboxylesterase
LIVAGSEDALIAPVQAETMKQRISDSQLHLVAQSGHLINLEQPQQFQNIVSQFVRNLSP